VTDENDKRLIEVAFPLKQASVDSVHERMARRIAAILLMEPELDANYNAVKESTYPWPGEGSHRSA